MTAAFRPCGLVPTYDNPKTVGRVVAALRESGLTVVVVDDGSAEPGRAACAGLAADPQVDVVHRAHNGGKGAAVVDGFHRARGLGYTHAFQVDADAQHELSRIPAFLAAAEGDPDALVLGVPEYDTDAPKARRFARKFTGFWVDLELGKKGIVHDAMVGFRVYPLDAALRSGARGRRMDFDVEILVRMIRAGCRVVNLPVRVYYPEDGVSNFQMFRDNVRFGILHSRLCTSGCISWVKKRIGLGKRER